MDIWFARKKPFRGGSSVGSLSNKICDSKNHACKGTNKREQYQRKTRFSLYCRVIVPSPRVKGTNKREQYKTKTFFFAFIVE